MPVKKRRPTSRVTNSRTKSKPAPEILLNPIRELIDAITAFNTMREGLALALARGETGERFQSGVDWVMSQRLVVRRLSLGACADLAKCSDAAALHAAIKDYIDEDNPPVSDGEYARREADKTRYKTFMPALEAAEATLYPRESALAVQRDERNLASFRAFIRTLDQNALHAEHEKSDADMRAAIAAEGPAGLGFSCGDEHLTILCALADKDRAVKASELDGMSGMPCYDTLVSLLKEMEVAAPALVIRRRGERSGYEITREGRDELIRRGLLDPPT